MKHISKEDFLGRLCRAREIMNEEGLDVLLVHADSAKPGDTYYIANYGAFPYALFTFPNAFANVLVVVPIEGSLTLFVSTSTISEAKKQTWIDDVRSWAEIRRFLGKLRKETKPTRIGIEGLDIMPQAVYHIIKKVLTNVDVKPSDIIKRLRAFKSEKEINFIRNAAKIADKGMRAAVEAFEEGKRERQIARVAKIAMISSGAEGFFFPPMVMSGLHSGFGVWRGGTRRIKKGDIVLIDLGPTYARYNGDLSRTVAFGEMTNEKTKVLDVCNEAHEKALGILRAGLRPSYINNLMEEVITKAGYEHPTAGIHGLGIAVDTIPGVKEPYDVVLQPNMTLVLKTEVHAASVGGARLEDDLLIKEDGFELLTRFEREPSIT